MSVSGEDLWVFAYGSLMWHPGFACAESVAACLPGYSREFCIYSVYYRGTLSRPGLVLGLARGGACEGVALRVAPADAERTRAYLRKRELIYGVYREASVQVGLHDGREITAIAYVAEVRHPCYAGVLPLARQAQVIRGAEGRTGTNLDYVRNTVRHLRAAGIHQPRIERLVTVIGAAAMWDEDRNGLVRHPAMVARMRSWRGLTSNTGRRLSRIEVARFTFRRPI